jgi:predicted secreted protein
MVTPTWAKIANVVSFSGPDGSGSEIDVSNLDSTWKEFLMGLPDGGSVSIEVFSDETDPGQIAARAAQLGRLLRPWKITLPNAKVIQFNAYVKKFSIQGGVDQAVKASIDLRISGGYTVT